MKVSPHKVCAVAVGFFCVMRILAGTASAADDPFVPYLQSAPTVVESLTTTNSGSGAAAVTTRTFTFTSRGKTNVIYAIEAAPQAAGKYPGLLVLHGGGGNAQSVAGIALTFAQRGYVTLAVDLPHLCQPNCSAKTTGPWRMRPLGEAPRFEVEPTPEQSVLLDAELAGLDGFNWLSAQPNVDRTKMGIFGYSWGGYSTTFLTGLLGDRVKAGYAVFGCGFYDKGSFWKDMIGKLSEPDRVLWLQVFDAGRRAPGIKAAYFLEGESNDTYFWPEAVGATVAAVPGSVNHVWGPNLNHRQVPGGAQMIGFHMDYYLKGIGAPFAKARVSGIEKTADNARRVTIDIDVPAGVSLASTQIFYSKKAANWQDRTWTAIDSTSAGASPTGAKRYVVTLGANLVSQPIDFYGFVTDSRGAKTSTGMYDSASIISLDPAADGGVGDAGGDAEAGGGGTGGSDSGAADGLPAAGGSASGDARPTDDGSAAGGATGTVGAEPFKPADAGRGLDGNQAGCNCQALPANALFGESWYAWGVLAFVCLGRRRQVAARSANARRSLQDRIP